MTKQQQRLPRKIKKKVKASLIQGGVYIYINQIAIHMIAHRKEKSEIFRNCILDYAKSIGFKCFYNLKCNKRIYTVAQRTMKEECDYWNELSKNKKQRYETKP